MPGSLRGVFHGRSQHFCGAVCLIFKPLWATVIAYNGRCSVALRSLSWNRSSIIARSGAAIAVSTQLWYADPVRSVLSPEILISISHRSSSTHDGPPRTRFGRSGLASGGSLGVLSSEFSGKDPPPHAWSMRFASVMQPKCPYPGVIEMRGELPPRPAAGPLSMHGLMDTASNTIC